MRESEEKEEDALYPEEITESVNSTEKEKYFEFYDDIKISDRQDW